MGAIIDILHLTKDEICLFKRKFPECVITNLSQSHFDTQRYRLIVVDIDLEEEYYNFLVDNLIGTASVNFKSRLDSDTIFKKKMTARAASNLRSAA